MKIYIAGKIAGDRRYRAKFREAAKALEAAGHVVLNPATLPDGLTDGDYMRIALAMLEASDLAVFLPDYQESRGAMADIGLRMLTPRELYRANGFPDDYKIERDYTGQTYGKSKQVARCGNAVPPPFATALVRANLPEWCAGVEINTMEELERAVAV